MQEHDEYIAHTVNPGRARSVLYFFYFIALCSAAPNSSSHSHNLPCSFPTSRLGGYLYPTYEAVNWQVNKWDPSLMHVD